MTNQQANDHRPEGGMQIDIGEVTAGGNVVIAGRDASVHSSTNGNSQEETTSIRIAGVEAEPEEAEALHAQLASIDEAIKKATLPPAQREAAEYNASALKQQMTSKSKANEHLLVQTTEALLTFGPDIAGAVVGAFTTPLAGKITSYAGERALELYNRLRTMKGEGFDH